MPHGVMNQAPSNRKGKAERGVKSSGTKHKRDVDALVEMTLRFDSRVRYCAIIDERGAEIAGGMRPGVRSLESKSEGPRLRGQSVIVRAMAETWDDVHGRADYMIVHRGRVSLFFFFLAGSRLLLVSTEPDYPLQRFQALAELIAKWKPVRNG